MSLPCCNEPPSCTWRPADSEALRVALSLPVSAAALAALHREMAGLQLNYPTGVCTAQRHLDAIAALDGQLQALTPAELNRPIRSRLKGVAGGVVPNPLPLRRLDVVEFATELLLEESDTEWDPAAPSVAAVLSSRRSGHVAQLVLLLPRLENWRQRGADPFRGTLVRS